MTPVLEVRDLRVSRNGRFTLAVDHLAVAAAEVLAVIGPNGSGKSTLLLALAQLLRPASGQVLFQGRPLQPHDGLAYRRRIGLVLQDPLLTDASVFDNVALGLRFRRLPKAEVTQRVDEWLARLGITHLRQRPSRQLSGGEAQRVSLARAFAVQPDVLLLDEPFSALDTPTRLRLLEDFQALLADTATTAVLVTHDMNEALMLSHQVAVLLGGRLRQRGSPHRIFNAPADADVAAFVGMETAVPGQVVSTLGEVVTVQIGAFCIRAVAEVSDGQSVLVCLRPEDVSLWPATEPPRDADNVVNGRITRLAPHGSLMKVSLDCGFPLVALVTRSSSQQMGLTIGQSVSATFRADAVHLIN